MPLDGSSRAEPVETPIYVSSATVDDDETILAGLCPREEDEDTREVCVVDLANGTYMRVPNSRFADDPAVSPDGTLVAFSSYDFNAFGEQEVYVYDVATEQTSLVTELPGFNRAPKWFPLPDQKCLIFQHEETLKVGIYLACLGADMGIVEAIPFGTYGLWFEQRG